MNKFVFLEFKLEVAENCDLNEIKKLANAVALMLGGNPLIDSCSFKIIGTNFKTEDEE